MKNQTHKNILWFSLGLLLVSFAVTSHKAYEAYAVLENDSTSLPGTDAPSMPPTPSSNSSSAESNSAEQTTSTGQPVPANKPSKPSPSLDRLRIPALGIDAPLERKGINAKGAMAVPKSMDVVGWFGNGPEPGEAGNAVMAGHVNNGLGLKGVFADLSSIKTGDDIYTTMAGRERHFIVRRVSSYDWNASAEEIFLSSDNQAHLVLITCEGEWLPELKTYSDRFVVFADLTD